MRNSGAQGRSRCLTLVLAFSKKGLLPKQRLTAALVTRAARAGSPAGAAGLRNAGEEPLAQTKLLAGKVDL